MYSLKPAWTYYLSINGCISRRVPCLNDSPEWQNLDSLRINRPGVAGAVLQSPPLLTDSFIHWVILLFKIFKTLSIPNRKSWGVEILRECSPPDWLHSALNVPNSKTWISIIVGSMNWEQNEPGLAGWFSNTAQCKVCTATYYICLQFSFCSV